MEDTTRAGTKMKGSGIVTGMDKLVNPQPYSAVDQIFDSSPARDINEGAPMNQGGIEYKGLKSGNPLRDGDRS